MISRNKIIDMRFNVLSVLITVFKIFCGITTFFMVGFWIYRFNENEDVSLIESISYETNSDIIYPELSVCITMPFIHDNLSLDKNYTVSAEEYDSYLKGWTMFRKEYKNIDLNYVTLDLLEYVEFIMLYINDNEVFKSILRAKGQNPARVSTSKTASMGLSMV